MDRKYSMEHLIPLTDEEIEKAFEEVFTAKKEDVTMPKHVSEKEIARIFNEPIPSKKDNINPDHYKSSTSLECIEAMEMVFSKNAVIDFCVCNAWKYIWRWKHKNGQEDLKKADWYINKAKGLIGTDPSYHTSAVNLGVINRMRNYISEHKEETND